MIWDQYLWSRTNALFSIIMALDRDLRIVRYSETLYRHLPEVGNSPLLEDLFSIKRPSSVTSYDELEKYTNSLFLLVSHDQRFAVRGQVTNLGTDENPYFCFVGFPWLSWLHFNRPELTMNLNLSDFRPHDAQMDQLFYISTERRMINDLEKLNLDLSKAKKRAENAQAEKDSFFAHISHEMRTPLNGVVSAITLLKDQKLPGQAVTLMKLAEESSNNLMQVINYVLDISKMEYEKSDPENVSFNLRQLVDSLIRVLGARAIEKKLNLYSEFEQHLPETYFGDPSRIRQSLLNLVANAINFTDYGEIAIRTRSAQGDGMTLRIDVSDSGIGIAKQDQMSIFEPFKTLPQNNLDNRKTGTGLGLDIVRRNVEFMGGRVGVVSEPGIGSTFWVELPCRIAPSNNQITPERGNEQDENLYFQGYVLLVDDNEANLLLGRMILQSMGLDVDTVTSGEKAVEYACNGSYDLVLMDISMPGIDGFEATRQIRAFRDANTLPILALSAYTSSAEKDLSVACGMDGYITKPIERDRMAKILSRWLKLSKHGELADQALVNEVASSLLDYNVLRDLARQIGNKNLRLVTDKFLEEVEIRLAALGNATTNEEISRQCHTLSSTCRSFGLLSVADKLSTIESLARAGKPVRETHDLDGIGSELKDGTKALQAAISSYAIGTE